MKDKLIVLNNENDINTFIKKLKYYKRFWYKNTNFILENNTGDKQCDYIINALNIKKRKERIKYIYESACQYINDYNKENNIDCCFEKNQCLMQHGTKFYNGCCRICSHQSQNRLFNSKYFMQTFLL